MLMVTLVVALLLLMDVKDMSETQTGGVVTTVSLSEVWREADWAYGSNGTSDGSSVSLKKLNAGVDKIRAQDINELRAVMEVLLGHQHAYVDDATVITQATLNSGC